MGLRRALGKYCKKVHRMAVCQLPIGSALPSPLSRMALCLLFFPLEILKCLTSGSILEYAFQ